MSRCVVFGGGEVTDDSYVLARIQPGDFVICADGGYRHALRLGITPDVLAGDFDSWLGERPNNCQIYETPSHKDETDSYLAVGVGLEKGFDTFLLFGMTGGRLDHTMANIQTLRYLIQKGVSGAILDAHEEIYVVKDGTLYLPAREGYSLSIFSLDEECRGVTLENVEYPLLDYTMKASFPIGVSNVFLKGQAKIAVSKGCLAALVCKL